MKKLKKRFLAIMAVCMSVIMAVCVGTGCKKDKYDPDAIQISISKMGYGTEWLHNIVEAYTEKTGIKVQITEEIGQEGNSKIVTQVESLVSSIDIAFIEGSIAKDVYTGAVSANGQTYDCLYAELTDVYKAEIAEESNATIECKMDVKTKEFLNFSDKYYALPWQGGVNGIVVNNQKWSELGFTSNDIPLTTEQLFSVCDTILSKNSTPFIYSLDDEYYTMFSPLWVAQYEGKESMELFLSGKDPDGNVTEYLYTYDGQLKALEVMKKLITTSGYQHSAASSLDFSDMQSYFLTGQAVFCVNGAWLEIEMSNYKDVDIGFIRTPVISSIVEKTPSIVTAANYAGTTPDEMLANVIKEIDAGKASSSYQGVTAEDYSIVKEAREISFLKSGTNALAVVPSYTSKLDKAKDFLKFMYSDEGLNIYYKTLNGATIPVKPTNGYTTDVTLSTFRQTINKAETDNLVFDYSSKAKIFTAGGVNMHFRNGSGTIVSKLIAGESPEQILSANITAIRNNWSNIKKYL